ncbi:MAG: DUF1273 family protein [Clostridia bacterium]|nr:DUF1273 family protein [Clostridia bacterium]
MEVKRCALTGHREIEKNFDFNRLHDALEDLIESGVEEFYCGMARGFDLIALRMLVEFKQQKKIRLIACIPFDGQERVFEERDQKEYQTLLTWCDERKIICEHYNSGCFLKRNRYMVENSDVVLAYLRKKGGGTFYTVEYARKLKKELYLI